MCAMVGFNAEEMNEPIDQMAAVIYARYSSTRQKDASIEQQIEECRKYARRNGFKVVGVYADRAITGTADRRPEFQQMIKDSSKGRWQLVITYKVDRFARNRYDAATYKARLKRNGVRLVYAVEIIPDGPEGILLESILEGAAEYYSANLAQNVKRGLYDNAKDCKVNSGCMPLGFKKGDDGRYAVEPAGAAVVREIFELYNEGIRTSQICDIMNKRGIRSSKGAKFNKNSIRNLLQNERYAGVYTYGEVRIEGGMPQIVPRDIFDSVQKRVAKMKYQPSANRSEVNYLLTGKLFCGHCRSPMVGYSGTGKSGAKYTYYACNSQRKHRCNKKAVRKDLIETLIVQETVFRVLRDDVIEKIAQEAVALQEREQDNSLVNSLQSQLANVNKSINNIMRAIEQGIFTTTTKQRLEELEGEKADLEEGLLIEATKQKGLTKEQIIYWIESFKHGKISDEAYRDTIIETFVNAVYLYDDKIKIVYNYSGDDNCIDFEIVNNIEETGEKVDGGVFDIGCQFPTKISFLGLKQLSRWKGDFYLINMI